jgi:hypothetical protein
MMPRRAMMEKRIDTMQMMMKQAMQPDRITANALLHRESTLYQRR